MQNDEMEMFLKIESILDDIECPDFALWLLLGRYNDNLKKMVSDENDPFKVFGMRETINVTNTILDDLESKLW